MGGKGNEEGKVRVSPAASSSIELMSEGCGGCVDASAAGEIGLALLQVSQQMS